MIKNTIVNVRAKVREFLDVLRPHKEIRDLREELYTLQRKLNLAEIKVHNYDVLRQEALRAEQLITGVQNHLRTFPNDTSRAVKNMLSVR